MTDPAVAAARSAAPVSLAILIVSIATLAWIIYSESAAVCDQRLTRLPWFRERARVCGPSRGSAGLGRNRAQGRTW